MGTMRETHFCCPTSWYCIEFARSGVKRTHLPSAFSSDRVLSESYVSRSNQICVCDTVFTALAPKFQIQEYILLNIVTLPNIRPDYLFWSWDGNTSHEKDFAPKQTPPIAVISVGIDPVSPVRQMRVIRGKHPVYEGTMQDLIIHSAAWNNYLNDANLSIVQTLLTSFKKKSVCVLIVHINVADSVCVDCAPVDMIIFLSQSCVAWRQISQQALLVQTDIELMVISLNRHAETNLTASMKY